MQETSEGFCPATRAILQAMTSKPTTMYIWLPDVAPMLFPSRPLSADADGACAMPLSLSSALGASSLLEPPCHVVTHVLDVAARQLRITMLSIRILKLEVTLFQELDVVLRLWR